MLFPKTNKYFHISRIKRSADVQLKIKNVSAYGSNMEYHIQDQRNNGRLAKKIQHFKNSAQKLCI